MVDHIDPNQFKDAIIRLAHFNPSCKDEYGNQVLDYLILDTLTTYGVLNVSQKEIISTIKLRFLIDFEESEIISAGIRLKNKGLITLDHDLKSNAYMFHIMPEYETKINGNLDSIKKLELDVIEVWHREIKERYKEHDIIINNLEIITESLHLFISKMFKLHGIESVAILYPDNSKTNEWQKSISSGILTEIRSADEFTDAVVKIEIPKFFRNSDNKRKTYILSLLNSSFFLHLVQVDEECSRLLRNITAGQKLFIDNNFLQCLVGIDGTHLLNSSHRLLELASKLGYELWITTKTIDEFHASLNYQLTNFRRKPPVTKELARIALENLEEDSFITTYWRELVEKGISIEDFILEKKHIDHILKGLEIKTFDEFRYEIEHSPELQTEIEKLHQITPPGINENILEHDAFHRILINKIRGDKKYHFSETKAWFLTNDSKLPVYDRLARKGDSSIPFCITSDQWIQVNRPLLTRTTDNDEYELSLYSIITQPFLRSLLPKISIEDSFHNVLSVLSRYKNLDSQLALKLIADKHFMITMAKETDEQEIQKQIDNKFVDIAYEYRELANSQTKKNAMLQQNIHEQNIILKDKDDEIYQINTEKILVNGENKKVKDKLINAEGKIKVLQWILYTLAFSFVTALIWFQPWIFIESGKKYIIGKALINFSLAIMLLFIRIRTSKNIFIATATFASGFFLTGIVLLAQ